MSAQLQLGEVWQERGWVTCSCGGDVAVCDRPIGPRLVQRRSRCLSCGSEQVRELAPPETPQERRERLRREVEEGR